MSSRKTLALIAIAALAVVVPTTPAFASEETVGTCLVEELEHIGIEDFEHIVEDGHASGASDEAKEALEEAENDLEKCVEAPSPIIPEINEVIWGGLAFLVLFGLMAWKLFPAVKGGMDARADKIREDLEAADKAKMDTAADQARYRAELDDAKTEASRIIDEARQQADSVRVDLQARAEADIAEMRLQAAADIEASKIGAINDLRGDVSDIALGAAEMVIGSNLDRSAHSALIDDYINQVASRS
ncbi:MAG: F0F1 ATP synthase subunit B [Acidimicrobiales bacterium]